MEEEESIQFAALQAAIELIYAYTRADELQRERAARVIQRWARQHIQWCFVDHPSSAPSESRARRTRSADWWLASSFRLLYPDERRSATSTR